MRAVGALEHDEQMAAHRVSALILDEHNLDEMAHHGVSAAEVVQVIANRHISAPNPRGEERSILLIGESDGGRLVTIPLAPTDDPTTWRPATGVSTPRGINGRSSAASPIGHHESVKAEDFDPIDEQAAEVHDGHLVELVVSVRLDPVQSRLLSELADAEGADPPATMRAALRHYAAAESQRASR